MSTIWAKVYGNVDRFPYPPVLSYKKTMIGGCAMSFGNHLYQARRSKGLSQEAVAEKLGVSRQTISKWETDETLPDIRQSKRLSVL